MNPSESDQGLSDFSKEIEKALLCSDILRHHLKFDIKAPQSWKQSYWTLYRNREMIADEEGKDEKLLKYLRLPARRKRTQRNLSVYDSKRQRLIVLPSELVHDAFCEICEYYLRKAKKSADSSLEKLFNKLKHEDLVSVFSYGSDPILVKRISKKLRKIIETGEKSNRISTENLFNLKSMYHWIRTYEDFYVPIIRLEKGLKPQNCILIEYSVENIAKNLLDTESISTRTLFLGGYISMSFPVELETTASNHIRVMSPPGMIFESATIPDFESEENLREFVNLDKFLDDDMLYFHVPKNKSADIMKLQEKRKGEKKNKARLKVTLNVGKTFPSLIINLILLAYASSLMPILAFFFSYEDFIYGFGLISSSVLITLVILISLAIYSLDRPFLNEFLAGQVLILTCIYIIELLFITPFW